ncbi:hypothetical protein AB0L40_22465 [Patulibacter sp. NPDC049589]|uniref:hypothetical protein n=1 Tax=Patulibacter sp. NPDC049589 TaxID=3154731 RepID=UPI0034378779
MRTRTSTSTWHPTRRDLPGRAVRWWRTTARPTAGTPGPAAGVVLIGDPTACDELREILDALPDPTIATVLLRTAYGHASTARADVARLALRSGARVHEWFGPPDRLCPDAETLLALVPDIDKRTVVVVGRRCFRRRTAAAAELAGAARPSEAVAFAGRDHASPAR